ncbi:flavin reductase family protein [Croceimicrobium sp.]|uniref:flavin reductase family protein n=1 Tax=Croceimicrobium sp. TaxID=2828340 RepID=UPI003BAD29A6
MAGESLYFDSADFEGWESRYRANFINSLGGFKSFNLLISRNSEGVLNAAPFFSVQHIGSNPPLLSLIFRPHTVERHSLENFRTSGLATINAVSAEIVDQAHQAAAKYPRHISELEAVGLSAIQRDFTIPYLKESHLGIGVQWVSEQRIHANNTLLVVASIKEVHLSKPEALIEDGLIEQHRLNTVSVNGLDTYYMPQPLKRLAYPEPDLKPKEKAWPKKN